MSDQIHQHKISDRYSATPYQGAPRCVLTGNATYSVSERHICFARIYRRINRGCCCRCSERLCIMHCMLSFARHIWGISFTFSKCARAVLRYKRSQVTLLVCLLRAHIILPRSTCSSRPQQRSSLRKSWRWNSHWRVSNFVLVQQWHPLSYESGESMNKTCGHTFFYFYSLCNTSYMAGIANNQRVKREVQWGVTLFWSCASLDNSDFLWKEWGNIGQ